MYKYQNGCLPILISLIGGSIFVFFSINLLLSIVSLFRSIFLLKNIVEPLLFVFMFTLACFFGLVLFSFFPALSINENGISVRYVFGLIKVNVFWKDIVFFQPHQIFRKIMIISFKKEGFSMLFPKSLFINAISGLWVGSEYPVLLLYKPNEYDDLFQKINNGIKMAAK